MNQRDFFDHYILNLSILWNFADFYMGEQFASFLGLPIVLLGRLLYFFSADLFYLLFMLIFACVFIVTFAGLRILPIEKFSRLLLPKIFGFMISLFWVKTKLINFILLGVGYNIFFSFIFRYLVSKDSLNTYLKDFVGLTFFWEKFLLLFISSFAAGIATNVSYHLLRIFSFVF